MNECDNDILTEWKNGRMNGCKNGRTKDCNNKIKIVDIYIISIEFDWMP